MKNPFANEELIEVYKHTLLNATQFHHGESYRFYIDTQIRKPVTKDFDYVGNIEVVNMDTVTALQHYSKKGECAVLNMASPKTCGGGVVNGSKAQEEALFRCSNLAFCIDPTNYPLTVREGIYTLDATFFKDVNYKMIKPINCDVITIAAYKRPYEEEDLPRDVYIDTTKKKITAMFSEALKNSIDNLILGAWGCGVYKNDPELIATLFKEVATKYKRSFENIIFAIINDQNSVGNNFAIFEKILNEK